MSANSIKEVLSVLRGPWGIALLAAYVLSVIILVIQRDRRGLKRGLMRTLVSLVMILITLGLTADRAVESPAIAQPWLGLLFGVAVVGLSLGLLFGGYRRFVQFKVWELEVGEAILGKALFVIVLPLLFLLLQGQVPTAWGFHLRNLVGNASLALVLAAIMAIPATFRLVGRLGKTPWTTSLAAFGIAFVYHVFQTGLPEEFFYRAYLQTHMEALLGSKWEAVILNAWLFGWGHILFYLAGTQTQYHLGLRGQGLKAVAYATLDEMSGGLMYAVVWAQTRSLIPLVFLHALVNTFSMAPVVAHKLIEGRAKRPL